MTEQLPEAFIRQMSALLGDELPDFLRSYDAAPLRGLRMNLLKQAPYPNGTQEQIPWCENGFYLALDSDAGALPLHEAGAYYIQEPSAMAPVTVLGVQKGDRVLDLCAAPGGKSTQIAERLTEGFLISNEPVQSRAKILSRNVERMGPENVIVISALPQQLADKLPLYFDKILVDAPCSGEGMFRKHPEARGEWSEKSPEGCSARQSTIIDSAAVMLRGGGRMVYSTCTFNRVENEGVILSFLARHPEFHLVPFAYAGGIESADGMLHIFPHKVKGEGHFVALLEKDGNEKKDFCDKCPMPDKAIMKAAESVLTDAMEAPLLPNAMFGEKAVYLREGMPFLNGIKKCRMGLHLGEGHGKVFLPDHALALARKAKIQVMLNEAETLKYLHGDVLPIDESLRGFAAPVYQGLQLGWGKATDGQLKNHYPKGLRK